MEALCRVAYLEGELLPHQDALLNLRIVILKNSKDTKGLDIGEIDLMIFDTNIQKYDKIISVKSSAGAHDLNKDLLTIDKLRNIPDANTLGNPALTNYLSQHSVILSSAYEKGMAVLRWVDARTGKSMTCKPSQASQLLKTTYTAAGDGVKFDPSNLGISKTDLDEGVFQLIVESQK
jgi:hypothetical protein